MVFVITIQRNLVLATIFSRLNPPAGTVGGFFLPYTSPVQGE